MVQTKKRKSPHRVARETSVVPVHRWFQFLESQSAQIISLPVTILFALLIRWCISLHGYSGRHTPPLYGDYEAQRHWMELTFHLPPSKWYYYDLQYWGLDYPPLTAFQSWLCGAVANAIDPSWVALDVSRGIETHSSKLFMRASVVVLEFVTLVPAVVLLFRLKNMQMSWAARQASIFSVLMQPCLLLVDHGHFQYNAVMLGFFVWTVYFAAREQHVLMAISFCCSFMFKQMGLYFAPAVFFFLFAQCFRLRSGGLLFAKLGVAVLGSVGIMLLPWLRSLDQLQQILLRVFPVARGLYEDKVANVWCGVNVVIKLRSLFDTQALVRLSTIATAIAFLPSCLHMFFMLWRQNSRYNNTTASAITLLRYCLLNTSLAFFLFSFQVHEKSILLPLAAALLLVDKEEWAVNWFVQVALFSLYPLLFKDGLCLPYWVMAVGWSLLRSCPACPRDIQTPPVVVKMQWLTTLGMLAIHICDALLVPPASLPNIFVVLNVLYSCGMFVLFFVYFYYRQFVFLSSDVDATKQKSD
ncbi:ALG6, ALG8 glycosyltransferase [Coemansia reversa NRRL 1564]|uniref:Alpha-1,3-glucosyltransferase n=1 Tax=Coemansia reversa (strain ATCC 12441 / NRRL 1564) TaxID=763665 RepID=A0A2G5BKU9_COERN|nr:ALG6, ALG8 glycosyltransferase [Coemansia reversa NRRL 1564]|eukprot:PIA19633.1 ALG6, ALG8 glycosyltransferase [Coemansia reversa NRRL 1564]